MSTHCIVSLWKFPMFLESFFPHPTLLSASFCILPPQQPCFPFVSLVYCPYLNTQRFLRIETNLPKRTTMCYVTPENATGQGSVCFCQVIRVFPLIGYTLCVVDTLTSMALPTNQRGMLMSPEFQTLCSINLLDRFKHTLPKISRAYWFQVNNQHGTDCNNRENMVVEST